MEMEWAAWRIRLMGGYWDCGCLDSLCFNGWSSIWIYKKLKSFESENFCGF